MEWLDEVEISGGINSNKKRKKREISYTKIEELCKSWVVVGW